MKRSTGDAPPSSDIARLVARLRFRHLQLLIELQRGGSLRAAAQVLALTQPALSKALGEVEGAFGFALFERSARGLAPTPRGAIAIRGAALLIEELAHVGTEAAAGDRAAAVLRIGSPPFLAQGYLPGLLTRLAQRMPPVRVQLQEERVPLLIESLLAGRLDALITSYPTEAPDAPGSALRYEKLFDTEFAVIAPAGHVLARTRRIGWARLAQERWIMPARSSMVRRVLEDAFLRAGVVPPSPDIESTSPVTNLRLVAAGLGLSALPASTMGLVRHDGAVVRLQVDPPVAPGPVALIARAGADNPRLALLREALAGATPPR